MWARNTSEVQFISECNWYSATLSFSLSPHHLLEGYQWPQHCVWLYLPFFLWCWMILEGKSSHAHRLGIHLTSWSSWIDCTSLCGKMARQWRKRQAFKLTSCFGNSPYPYRMDIFVQIRSCNQRCYNGGTLQNIWCSCKQRFCGFCCEKGEQYCYTLAQCKQLCEAWSFAICLLENK